MMIPTNKRKPKSIAAQHNEWISLLEVSGPFLSLEVLLQIFPQGLPTEDSDQRSQMRRAFEEWELECHEKNPNPALHRAWIRYILQTALQLPQEFLRESSEIPQQFRVKLESIGETLQPDWVLLDSDDNNKARLLVQFYDVQQGLEKPARDKLWKASPATRMADLLRGADVPLGLVTNGNQWMLVHAPRGETASYVSWFAPLWLEERPTWQAFVTLLGRERFFGVAEKETLEAMFAASLSSQQEVTDELGRQVRQALEVLVARFDEADAETDRKLLQGISPKEIYEGTLAVMMRLVFLFCAEENKLLLQSDSPFYETNYSVSQMRAELHEIADQHGEELLSNYFDAWDRLLATFRLLYGGAAHEELQFPAYGGALFDPDRWPWLEGREAATCWKSTFAEPPRIDNRTVLHLLEALQVLQVKIPGGGKQSRVLSFRALDIEQIGHVYEGLLDHTARRAGEAFLSLEGAGGLEPEIALSVLESESADAKNLVKLLKKETGRSVKAIENALAQPLEDEAALIRACNANEVLLQRVRPFANLLRRDSFDRLVVIRPGSLFVTQGSDRRQSGAHYTTRALTEPLVKHTLDPLLYRGFAEGIPATPETLLSPREILHLKICDPACGSASVLVQTCRYLSEKLVEAWEIHCTSHNNNVIPAQAGIHSVASGVGARHASPLLDSRLRGNDGKASRNNHDNANALLVAPYAEPALGLPGEMPLPADADERLALARRLVAERCLYGVDSDPLAVEMARLSLWLVTMQKCKPFTFLDHAIRLGDSLLGVDWHQLETQSLDRQRHDGVAKVNFSTAIKTAVQARRHIAELAFDVPAQQHELEIAEKAMQNANLMADAVIAPALLSKEEIKARGMSRLQIAGGLYQRAASVSLNADSLKEDLRADLDEMLDGKTPFHWPLQFPEVFWREGDDKSTFGGFDAIVGNPPFQGGLRISGALGVSYRDYLVESLARNKKGSADLVTYFYLRAFDLLKDGGNFGLIATNTIAEGDTREVGLDQIDARGGVIFRAHPSQKWPGKAALEVAIVYLHKGVWKSTFTLAGEIVSGITSFLAPPGKVIGKLHRLEANGNKSFIGSYVLGAGFVLEPDEAKALIAKDERNGKVLFPYLNGQDLNTLPDQNPVRWVINFQDWPLSHATAPSGYSGPVAQDYPDCLAIVEQIVKPSRAHLMGRNAIGTKRATDWWLYASDAKKLYEAIANSPRVLAKALTSKFHMFHFLPNGLTYDQTCPIFAFSDDQTFALLQSTIHEVFALKYGGNLENRPRYTPTDVFETFPFPNPDESTTKVLSDLGERYHALRATICRERNLGLTKVYNLFHDVQTDGDIFPVRGAAPPFADIRELRQLHQQMDEAVLRAYGWDDVNLDHGFHATPQGDRFTISEPARNEILDRLLQLNHDRYAEEVEAGLHDKGAKAKAKKQRKAKTVTTPTKVLSPTSQGKLEM